MMGLRGRIFLGRAFSKLRRMARILFVDDDPYTLETLTKAVELFGHQAVLASSGAEALKLAAAETPDLVFIDLMLPDMNGLEVVSQLSQQPAYADVPIYILSAAPEKENWEHARSVGARAYINKPMRLQTLLDFVQEMPG